MKLLSFMSRRKLFVENLKLKKEKSDLAIELDQVHRRYEKEKIDYEKEMEEKYSNMDKRNNTLSEDNRRLIAIGRKKDKKIIELKKKIKELEEAQNV